MSKLSDFLAKRDTNITDEVAISATIPFKFKIRALNSDEYTTTQKECAKISKKGRTEFDSKKFNEQIILTACVDPDFKNAEEVKAAGCITPAQYLNKVLLPGEQANLVQAISFLSGFDKDLEELKGEAKNS